MKQLARFLLGTACLVSLFFGQTHAQVLNNNEIEFTGTVMSVVPNGTGGGTVFVHLDVIDLRVLVNAKTVLENDDEEIALTDLKDQKIKVAGKYSSGGILASRIEILGDVESSEDGESNDFQLCGHITALSPSDSSLVVSMLGIDMIVNDTTSVSWNGAEAGSADLQIGQKVCATGTMVDGVWTAGAIQIAPQKKDWLLFEGTVESITTEGDVPVQIEVKIEGTETVTVVVLDENTRIVGDIKEGALVTVKGYLNDTLGTVATKIIVFSPLEIAPDRLKLKVGETATLSVKLWDAAADDMTVTLSVTSADPDVIALDPSEVTIPKGEKTAEFSVTAGNLGTAVITASDASGETATAEVIVGEVSENESVRAGAPAGIAFAPPVIKMAPNETRDVVLLIWPPQQEAANVIFDYDENFVNVLGQNDFSNGVAALKATIQAGADEGTGSVIANLEDGSQAELVVEVAASNGAAQRERTRAQIEFHPAHINLAEGESQTVSISLSQLPTSDVTLSLQGDNSIVDFPETVTVDSGKTSASFEVKGIGVGKAAVTAVLPEDLGGDKAKLNIQVRSK